MIAQNRSNTVAVVGAGYWGRNLVRNFARLKALSAVCDADADLAARQAKEFDVPVMAWESILASDAIPAVAVATPAVTHARIVRQALEAGKHVFVEKPLALDLQEAEQLCALAKERRRTLMVGHLLQYHPAFLTLKELVVAGRLGRLRYIYSNRLNFGRFRSEEDILWSFAPHDISMIIGLIGEEPQEVFAIGAAFLNERVADITTTHLSFSGGERAHIHVSWLHPVKEQRLVVIGDRAMAVFNDGESWDRKLLLFNHKIRWSEGRPTPEAASAEPVPLVEVEPLTEECRHFIDSFTSGTPARTDGEEGLRVLRVLAAASQSLKRG